MVSQVTTHAYSQPRSACCASMVWSTANEAASAMYTLSCCRTGCALCWAAPITVAACKPSMQAPSTTCYSVGPKWQSGFCYIDKHTRHLSLCPISFDSPAETLFAGH